MFVIVTCMSVINAIGAGLRANKNCNLISIITNKNKSIIKIDQISTLRNETVEIDVS